MLMTVFCFNFLRCWAHVSPDLYGAEFNVKFDDPDRILTHGQAKNQLVPVDALQDPGQILDITFGVARVGVSISAKRCGLSPDLGNRIEQFQNSVLVRGQTYWADLRCFRSASS